MIAVVGLFISYITSGCALIGPGREHKSEDALVEAGAESKSQCVRIVKFSQAGKYKTAVDIADELNKAGYRCSKKVLERIHFSRSKLNKADAYVLKSKNRKKDGKLLSARTNLQKALEIYPKYYWAQNLLKKVELSINAEITGFKGEARNLESKGDLEGALLVIEKARVLSPGDRPLELEAARLQVAVEKSLQEEKGQKKLEEILSHKDTGNFEETKKLLEEEAVAKRLGKEGEERLKTIRNHRQSLIRKGLVLAREAEQKGNLEAAAGHTMYVLKLSSAGEFLSSDTVEFTRLLGMKFFSAGNFSKARDLWEGALRLSPGNSKLQKYLAQVEECLDNLKKIRK
jgi:tetratricopeptide (TPR) repeat protein